MHIRLVFRAKKPGEQHFHYNSFASDCCYYVYVHDHVKKFEGYPLKAMF